MHATETGASRLEPLAATPLALAAMASAGAGLVHAAAAGSHQGDRTLAVLFAVAAVTQLGWGGVALARPGRAVAASGALLNLALVGVWLATRTVGIPAVASLASAEAVGFQDTMAAALTMAAVSLATWSVASATGPGWLHRPGVASVAAVAIMAVSLPAVAVGHTHDHGPASESTDDQQAPAAALATPDPAAVAESTDPVVTAELAVGPGEVAAGPPDHAHPELGPDGPMISLYDPRLSPEQRDAARRLIDDTRAGMERFPDIDSVIGAGYLSIGDGITGYEHWVHPGHITDGRELDPERIESIVARVHPDGSKEIVSAMYLMAPGSTMDDVPDIAGPLTTWHDHQDLCWEGVRVVGRTRPDGTCPVGEFRATAPMLHVWLVPHPCGPFAGIEGHGEGCAHDH